MKVTIFGSSSPKPGEHAYTQAYALGNLLARAGHTVLTGGYMGTMEAVSHGAADAGGHVIGVTCEEIERWRGSKPNPWVMEEWRCGTLDERIRKLIDGCDAAAALPGGPGTLAELSLMWNRLIIAAIPPKPLILIGPEWHKSMETYITEMNGNIRANDRDWLIFAETVESVTGFLS